MKRRETVGGLPFSRPLPLYIEQKSLRVCHSLA